MKKAFLLSFIVLTVALSVGCTNGLPRNCLLRKWFCGKECYQESCYTPDTCTTCPTCPSCQTGVVVGDPFVSDSSCSSCTAPSLPAATPTITTPSPAPYTYNN